MQQIFVAIVDYEGQRMPRAIVTQDGGRTWMHAAELSDGRRPVPFSSIRAELESDDGKVVALRDPDGITCDMTDFEGHF